MIPGLFTEGNKLQLFSLINHVQKYFSRFITAYVARAAIRQLLKKYFFAVIGCRDRCLFVENPFLTEKQHSKLLTLLTIIYF